MKNLSSIMNRHAQPVLEKEKEHVTALAAYNENMGILSEASLPIQKCLSGLSSLESVATDLSGRPLKFYPAVEPTNRGSFRICLGYMDSEDDLSRSISDHLRSSPRHFEYRIEKPSDIRPCLEAMAAWIGEKAPRTVSKAGPIMDQAASTLPAVKELPIPAEPPAKTWLSWVLRQ